PGAEVEMWHGAHTPAAMPLSGRDLAAHRRAQLAELARRAQTRRRGIAAASAGPGLLAVGEIAHVAPYGLPAALALGSIPLATAGFRRLRDLKRAEKAGAAPPVLTRWDRASLAVRGGVAAWLPSAAAVGAWGPLPMRDAVLIGWPVAAGAYLWRNRTRRAPVVAEEIPDPVAVWADLVGGPGCALAGSHLVGLVEDAEKWTATIELVRGRQEWKDVIGALGKISTAYNIAVELIVVEPVRGRPATARISVFKRMPLQKSPVWEGPHRLNTATGTAPFVAYTDGTVGEWRWWSPQGSGASGVTHGLVAGTTGAGKSRLLALKLAYERATPLMVSWVADPQGGQSLPEWVEGVDWYGRDMDEIAVMLHAARALMYDRSKRLAETEWIDDKGRRRIGKSTFTPTPDMPLIAVTIDEAHRVLDPNDGGMVELVDEMARMGRKCGVSLTLATHVPTLGDLQRTSLKGMLAGGNVMVLRTGEKVSGNVIATQPLPSDPYELPKQIELEDGSKFGTGGLGFFLGGAGRPAICRVMDVGDEYHWATAGETTAAGADDERVLAAYAGDAYLNRRDRKRAAVKLEDLPGESVAGAVAPILRSVPTGTPSKASAPNTRDAVLKILRGTGAAMTAAELGRKVQTLTGTKVAANALHMALSRAAEAGEVERLDGDGRAARWRAA
ncbi:MAG TPA: hypothetical protein VFL71_20250, partial [Actinomycetes bacterium]|nr:hypothetical protein [Actinomycetes bacterium]